MELKVGDRIERTADYAIDPPIEIVAVRPTGYSWRYVGGATPPSPSSPTHRRYDLVYESDNTKDPFFNHGWSLIQASEVSAAHNGLPL